MQNPEHPPERPFRGRSRPHTDSPASNHRQKRHRLKRKRKRGRSPDRDPSAVSASSTCDQSQSVRVPPTQRQIALTRQIPVPVSIRGQGPAGKGPAIGRYQQPFILWIDWWKVLLTDKKVGVTAATVEALHRLVAEPGITPAVISYIGPESIGLITDTKRRVTQLAYDVGLPIGAVPSNQSLCFVIVPKKRRNRKRDFCDNQARPTKGEYLSRYGRGLLLDDQADNCYDCLSRCYAAVQIHTGSRRDSGELVTLPNNDFGFQHVSPQPSFRAAADRIIQLYRSGALEHFLDGCAGLPFNQDYTAAKRTRR